MAVVGTASALKAADDDEVQQSTVEIQLRSPSKEVERILVGRLRVARLVYNQIITEVLRRDACMRESTEYRRLTAENLSSGIASKKKSAPRRKCKDCKKNPVSCAKCMKRGTPPRTPSLNPRKVSFENAKERGAAWTAMKARFDLLGKFSLADFVSKIHKAQALWVSPEATLPCTLIHELARRVWDAYEPFLLGKRSGKGRRGKPGRRPFFKPLTSISSRSTEKNHGPLRFIEGAVEFGNGLRGDARSVVRLPALIDMDDPIIARAFAVDDAGALKAEIKQLRLGYREIGSRKRWFVQFVQGLAPYKKPWLVQPKNAGDVGIDIGSKHIAVVVPDVAHAENITLNANVANALRSGKAAERRRARAQDRSKRAMNPDCFDAKGRYKKGKRIAVRSKGYHAHGAERREMHRQMNETKRQQRNALANRIIEQGQALHYEAKLSYPGWQASGMGTSMLSSTPGGLMTAIEKACAKYGRDMVAIDYRAAKLSQVCHECGQYHKDPIRGSIESRLSTCDCGRLPMQRDIYSAFLASQCDASGTLDVRRANLAWPGMSRRYGAASAQAGVSLGVTTSSAPARNRNAGNRGATKGKPQTNRGDSVERRPVRTKGLVTLNIDHSPSLDHHALASNGETSTTSVSEADEVARAPIGDSDERRHDDGAERGRSTLIGRASPEQMALGISLGDTATARHSKNVDGSAA